MKSPVYWHPKIYTWVMKKLEGEHYNQKFEALSEEIGEDSLLDIGCGDCELFKSIKRKNKYLGIDMNLTFIRHARHRGINVKKMDIFNLPIPIGFDVILFSGILHQLVPRHEEIMTQALQKAKKKVIICEAETHVASSKNFFIRKIANFLNNPGRSLHEKRLSKEELTEFYQKFNVSKIDNVGRNTIAIFDSSESHTPD